MSDKVEQFFSMEIPADVAAVLGTTLDGMNYWLYYQKPKYYEFQIPKRSGGYRTISRPNDDLAKFQRRLNLILQDIYMPRPSVYSYVKGRSIVGNARQHTKKRFVLNVDLKDFFPSIHFGRVRGLFIAKPFEFPLQVANTLARICSTYQGLPQGAPTSPIVSNMICRGMDYDLQMLAKEHQCYYTRYADDITISTSRSSFPTQIARVDKGKVVIGELVSDVIGQHGFIINSKKIRLQNRFQRQQVTGITVNRFTNVNRKYINQVRAMLHDLNTRGEEEALKRHLDEETGFRKKYRSSLRSGPTSFREIVRGKIEYLGQVRGKNDKVYRDFMSQLGIQITSTPKIFLNYASEDVDEVQKLHDLIETWGYEVWMDTSEVRGGDEWWEKIKAAINESSIFVACVSISSERKAGPVQDEIDYALEKLKIVERNQFFIIPLLIHEGLDRSKAVQSKLGKFSYLKYFKSSGIIDLRDSIKEHITKLGLN